MDSLRWFIVHCSDSPWGDALELDQWHNLRKFRWLGFLLRKTPTEVWGCARSIGYNYVIGNGRPFPRGDLIPVLDGAIAPGRPEGAQTAQCPGRGMNMPGASISVCLVGPPFTAQQLLSLRSLFIDCNRRHPLDPSRVLGHSEVMPRAEDGSRRDCPCLPMPAVRDFLATVGPMPVSIMTAVEAHLRELEALKGR